MGKKRKKSLKVNLVKAKARAVLGQPRAGHVQGRRKQRQVKPRPADYSGDLDNIDGHITINGKPLSRYVAETQPEVVAEPEEARQAEIRDKTYRLPAPASKHETGTYRRGRVKGHDQTS